MAWFWLIGFLALPVAHCDPIRSPDVEAVESASQKLVDHLSYEFTKGPKDFQAVEKTALPASQSPPAAAKPMVRKVRKSTTSQKEASANPTAESAASPSVQKPQKRVSWARMVRRAGAGQPKPAVAGKLKDAWSKMVNKYSQVQLFSRSIPSDANGHVAKPRMVRKRRAAAQEQKMELKPAGDGQEKAVGKSGMMRREGFSAVGLADVDDNHSPKTRGTGSNSPATAWSGGGMRGTYGAPGTMIYDKATQQFIWPTNNQHPDDPPGAWAWGSQHPETPPMPNWRPGGWHPEHKWFWNDKGVYAFSAPHRRRSQYNQVSGINWQTGSHGLYDTEEPAPEYSAGDTHSVGNGGVHEEPAPEYSAGDTHSVGNGGVHAGEDSATPSIDSDVRKEEDKLEATPDKPWEAVLKKAAKFEKPSHVSRGGADTDGSKASAEEIKARMAEAWPKPLCETEAGPGEETEAGCEDPAKAKEYSGPGGMRDHA